MIGKISKPVLGKLTGIPFSGDRTDGVTSPRSPLDFKIQSPRGPKSFNYDSCGVGLAIVAALHDEKTNYRDAQSNKSIVYNRSFKNSIPIPLRNNPDMDNCEDYTIVTCRGPDQKLYTKVYGTGINQVQNQQQGFVERRARDNVKSVFDISPAKFGDFSRHQDSDFLSSCHLCHKKLHGKDIYMYRGEKAFCSTECRYSQMVMDEHKEKYCGSEISRSADIAGSPYANGQMFSTGILAI